MQSKLNDFRNEIITINKKMICQKNHNVFEAYFFGHGRDRDCDHGRNRSSFYRKNNHQNPATDPNLNVIRGGRINKFAKNNSHVECFHCHKKSHYALICSQSQKSGNGK